MPRPRFSNLPLERQRKIIAAAGKILGESGYEGATLSRIFEEAGLSKGAGYYYFDSKDDLVAEVFLELWGRMKSVAELDTTKLTPENFWESTAALVQRLLEAAREEPWAAAAIKAIWGLPPGARSTEPLASALRAWLQWFATILHRGRDLGVIRRDMPAELLLAVCVAMDEAADRWVFEHWDELDEATINRYSATMFAMLRRVLEPELGAGGGPGGA